MPSTKIKSTNKTNPCPVCGNVSGHCKTTSTELVLCAHTLDAASTPEGWKFLDRSKGGGQWGKIVPSGQPESGNSKALRLQRAAEQAAIEAARMARLKPKKERDEDYRYRVANHPASSAAIADLTRRGLDSEDLAKLTPISDARGNYIVPIRDLDGLMVGGQVRSLAATKGAKYFWATKGENHLPESKELPLAHWVFSGEPEMIALCEGTGAKPYLASKRLEAVAIGAAGGNFCSSPKTLKATLDRHSDLPVVLMPDGGAVENKSVMRQYLAVYTLLKSWGRELSILWWGQLTKADGDIDEIGPEVVTSTIAWAEFVAIAAPILEAKGEDPALLMEEQKRKPAKDSTRNHYATSSEEGLVWVATEKADDGGFIEKRERIGNHLEAIAYLDTPTQDEAAILLEFGVVRGGRLRWTMPRAELSGDGGEICRGLLGRGYWFDRKQKNHLLRYLQGLGANIEQTYTITDSSGWVGNSFVLPHKTYGDPDLRFRDVDPSPESLTEVVGTLEGWKSGVAARCGGNSRLILALGAQFAAPLLKMMGIESGGFHLVGPTSSGKTTILSVSGSVLGLKEIPHWRTTTNGLESTATASNHLCLPLDEIGQADPKDVGAIAYMLANGQGKARMKKDLSNRKGKTWQLLFLSSGEIGLGEYMAQAGQTQKGGQEVRSPDVPAIPEGSEYGCFESIHGATDAVQFVSGLEAAVRANHGTAMDAYLSRLVADTADQKQLGQWSKQTHLIAAKLSEGFKDTAIGRVAKRFALVQVALGIAHQYGLLPFPAEDIDWAIDLCFKDWVKGRGGGGPIEVKRAIERIEHLLVSNELGDRVFTLPDNNGQKVRSLLAYRKLDINGDTEYLLIPPSIFDKEFCQGVNKSELVKALQSDGLLRESDSEGRADRNERIGARRSRVYFFRVPNSGNWQKPLGTMGTMGTEGRNDCSDRLLDDERCPQTTGDTLGAMGTNPQADSVCPHCPQAENDIWGQIRTPETLTNKGLEGGVPIAPIVPTQKTDIPNKGTTAIEKPEEC
jgi:uncharacterized protein (DUF927 family)